jgi:hypothetical protein
MPESGVSPWHGLRHGPISDVQWREEIDRARRSDYGPPARASRARAVIRRDGWGVAKW